MSVYPGKEHEYEQRHRLLWFELEAVLRAHGVHNYSIFLHPETHQLFAYAEIEDEVRWTAVANSELCRRWWASMTELMPSNADCSPVSQSLRELFHLD
jgi:L-rhamnose mutarotase